MNVELTEKNLYWEVEGAARDFYDGEKMDFSEINSGVEELIGGAESCMKMISDRKNLTNKEFYDMLLKFAYITDWNDYDCYKVLELAYNMKFVSDAVIKTTMHAVFQKTEGHGRDFSWWDEEVGIDFKVVYTKDFKVDYEHAYSVEEIKRLIDEKKIVIISEEERSLAWDKKNYKKEGYQRFDNAYDDYSMKHRFFDETGKFYPYTLRYIRSRVNKKELLKLFKEHLEHANREIYDATHKSCWNGEHFKKAVEQYSGEFKKQGYAKRLTKLNSNK